MLIKFYLGAVIKNYYNYSIHPALEIKMKYMIQALTTYKIRIFIDTHNSLDMIIATEKI